MTQSRSQHYWRQLRCALTAGQWDASTPARDWHQRPVSWSDLIRKFLKHNPEHRDVAELASQTQALSLLLSANASSLDGNDVGSQGPLALGDECVLPEERIEEARAGYDSLKQLDASRSDSTKAALAYYAFALRKPSESLEYLSQIQDVADAQGFIPFSATETVRSAATLHVPGASSDTSLSSSWTGSFVSAQAAASIADIDEGRAWSAVERIRSICLQGMSCEMLYPNDLEKAFSTYLLTSGIISTAVAEIPASVPSSSTATQAPTASENSSFARYREFWRWAERALRRAIVLGARICDIARMDGRNGSLWQLFQQYHACSAHWPPLFRPDHRSAIAVLYLRALILRARAAVPSKGAERGSHRWMGTARSIVQEYMAILSVSTTFPKAGERNWKVEDLVDLSVAAWEADGAIGEYAGWVLDVLWWATRLTFNSFRVFRHMSRLFYVGGDPDLAKRTLRLYIQIVSKAREASLAEQSNTTADADGAFGAGVDVDTDELWVQTCVLGSRMLSRLALGEEDVGKAIETAREAGEVLEKGKTRLNPNDKELMACSQLAEAIWHIATAYTEQDPRTRTKHFDESLALLNTSLETNPTPSAHHHLALAYTRPGASQDLQEAIVHARAAVEGDSSEPRHWHLLGLLLTATGNWRAAKEVLEMGVSASDADLVDDEPDSVSANGDAAANGVQAYDFAYPPSPMTNGQTVTDEAEAPSPPRQPVRLLDKDATEVPLSSSLLQPFVDRSAPTRQDAFEQALQLRMTQLTLTEFVEGPEGTGDKWVEVFQWFSERRPVGADDRRMSIDSRRSQDIRPTSMLSGGVRQEARASAMFPLPEEQPENGLAAQDPPIPIMVTPASPMGPSPAYSSDQLNGDHQLPVTSAHEAQPSEKSRLSTDTNRGKGKKVREVFISGVHKGRARVTTISKKIGHNVQHVGRHHGVHLKRSNSAPDFHAMLNDQSPFQASSIHLRQHLSIYAASQVDFAGSEVPPPPPSLPPPEPTSTIPRQKARAAKDRRLLSNLWLMSSATFRRLGKIEQARGAIQEAEVRDENNPAVWVQLGLYHLALGDDRRALECFQKALFISPNDVSATIHLCRIYLASAQNCTKSKERLEAADRDNVDLAVGMLSELTKGAAWDVPEAWYFLAKMYALQGRKDRERECLCFALTLSENRPLRDIGTAVGWCL
ncbi:hypothetical protein BD309DRAFT_890639 [Dichomitus squalens]|uniref:Uncharacterized protein n=1 Tax=Dichomitus squalens TaxID=114155 RepID=A0A4Q9PZH9_9APHY|nr:hypothetical protein BD309DRAFT_890639 [Dichomitus squalens]TBU60242.1 hypothetical protein BD310DRAFT_875661 [Dichomitus squalens]